MRSARAAGRRLPLAPRSSSRSEHLRIGPAQHQLHHSDDPRRYDRNCGSARAIWDWVGGSLHVPAARERVRCGLPRREQNHQRTVRSALVDPLRAGVGRLLG